MQSDASSFRQQFDVWSSFETKMKLAIVIWCLMTGLAKAPVLHSLTIEWMCVCVCMWMCWGWCVCFGEKDVVLIWLLMSCSVYMYMYTFLCKVLWAKWCCGHCTIEALRMYYYYYLSEKEEEEKCKEIDQPAVKSDTLHTHTHCIYPCTYIPCSATGCL